MCMGVTAMIVKTVAVHDTALTVVDKAAARSVVDHRSAFMEAETATKSVVAPRDGNKVGVKNAGYPRYVFTIDEKGAAENVVGHRSVCTAA